MVDIALDTYTDHGHDGLIDAQGYVLNDASVHLLSQLSLSLAMAGADVVAPSDMMDGRVAAIRKSLDENGLSNVNILAYAAKYCSCLYSPFRGAVQSHLTLGDKKNYQLNPANVREALLEAQLDEQEGADMLLVKPALPYLDVLVKIKQQTHLPVGAYHVSGEYAMLHAASQLGYLDYDNILFESMISLKRAGADFIITNGALDIASKL
jgi:porphobilinogen synthase